MLALWEFFWTTTDWTGASAAIVVVGGSKGSDYHPLPDEFWEIRARYLRRFVEPTVRRSRESVRPAEETTSATITRATIEAARLSALQAERDMLYTQLQTVQNGAELQRQSAKLLQLSLDILAANERYYERAAVILLLDIL